MSVTLRLAAGCVSSYAVSVPAYGRLSRGWVVCIGHTFDMTPIISIVPDASVIEIEVEPLPEVDASDEDTAEWFAEAA